MTDGQSAEMQVLRDLLHGEFERGVEAKLEAHEQALKTQQQQIDDQRKHVDDRLMKLARDFDERLNQLGQRLDTRMDNLSQRLDDKFNELSERLDGQLGALRSWAEGEADESASRLDEAASRLDESNASLQNAFTAEVAKLRTDLTSLTEQHTEATAELNRLIEALGERTIPRDEMRESLWKLSQNIFAIGGNFTPEREEPIDRVNFIPEGDEPTSDGNFAPEGDELTNE